ncbi:MAG: ABC transporter ATP-binding protein [Clostridia bacterium]|nr:ABC transporter ATP-binding protein [Clostridia bacterium]MDD6040128.1 ABC transporter ATP-binding protein [Clostridia bacterium]
MSDVFLSASQVKRCFSTSGGDFWALKGVSAAIPRGKLTILKGRSGSGKTTLLNILGALDKPTEGDVLFDGQSIVSMSERSRARLRRMQIGFVFQSVALIPMMNALENVQFALRMAHSRENHAQRAMECLKMVGLAGRMQHMPQELSGGEQQRVAIARAIAHRPRILFADEPTGELDTTTGLQVVKIFQELCRREGVTIVMTTHDTGLMEIGDAVFELEDGEIISGR